MLKRNDMPWQNWKMYALWWFLFWVFVGFVTHPVIAFFPMVMLVAFCIGGCIVHWPSTK